MLDFEKMKNQLLNENGVNEDSVAADSTGFSPGQASLYYQTRTGRLYQRWVKGVYAVGTASQFILAWRSGWGPGSDVAYLPGLRRDARRYGRYQGKRKAWVMMADAGFDGQTVRDDDLIPPIRRGGTLLNPERKARADLVSQARLDGLFGQRWKTETVNSVIKRKFGDTIRSRKRSLQRREPDHQRVGLQYPSLIVPGFINVCNRARLKSQSSDRSFSPEIEQQERASSLRTQNLWLRIRFYFQPLYFLPYVILQPYINLPIQFLSFYTDFA